MNVDIFLLDLYALLLILDFVHAVLDLLGLVDCLFLNLTILMLRELAILGREWLQLRGDQKCIQMSLENIESIFLYINMSTM